MDLLVDVAQNDFGHLTITYDLKNDLYIQNDSDIDSFLDGILPENYHTEYVGKKSARSIVDELKSDIKEGFVTTCLISSLYFPEVGHNALKPEIKEGTHEQKLWKIRNER